MTLVLGLGTFEPESSLARICTNCVFNGAKACLNLHPLCQEAWL